jgi:hypothetical protein
VLTRVAMPICAGCTSLRFRKIEKVATTDVQRIFISSATARSKRLMMLDAPAADCVEKARRTDWSKYDESSDSEIV